MRKHGERAKKLGLSEEKLCIFMGTNRLGQELVLYINRAKPNAKEVIQQNKLTNRVVFRSRPSNQPFIEYHE